DRPVVAALRHPDRCLVTPEPDDEARWLAGLAHSLEAGGIRRVHLRSRTMDGPRWRALVERALPVCRQAGAEVLVNGDVALARDLGVGVQLRAGQLAGLAERPLPAGQPVGASCH